MQLLMSAPFMLVRPNHYVVTAGNLKGRERIVLGLTIPLSKRAAEGYVKGLPGGRANGDYRVIMRKTAQRAGML